MHARRRFMGVLGATIVAGGLLVAVEPASALVPPAPPGGLAAIAGPKTAQMTVTWTAPPNTFGQNITYTIATALDGGAFGPYVSAGKAKRKVLTCAAVTTCEF